MTKIALIHATTLAMQPIDDAFALHWPQAQRMSVLDDTLSRDLAKAESLNEALIGRFKALAAYAKNAGADGVLFTCSAFGPAIEAAAQHTGLPTLKPNEAMFEDVIHFCTNKINDTKNKSIRLGLLTSFLPASRSMLRELEEALSQHKLRAITIQNVCADQAMSLLAAGQKQAHDDLVIAAAKQMMDCDVLLLGQFSLAHLQQTIAAELNVPVLSSPVSSVKKLQTILNLKGTS